MNEPFPATARKCMKRDDSAGYLANHMARLFKAMLNRRLAPLGLTTAPLGILLELWSAESNNQRDLVERPDIEQATIANTLARMERDGLVERQPDPSDGRRHILRPSARAQKMKTSATACARETNAAALSCLSGEERKAFVGMMRRVIAAQRKALGDFTIL
jgi:DNA-binding MarR family transcriptional regulator